MARLDWILKKKTLPCFQVLGLKVRFKPAPLLNTVSVPFISMFAGTLYILMMNHKEKK